MNELKITWEQHKELEEKGYVIVEKDYNGDNVRLLLFKESNGEINVAELTEHCHTYWGGKQIVIG